MNADIVDVVLQMIHVPEAEALRYGSGSDDDHSLRSGQTTPAEVDERYRKKYLGHGSAEMI